MASRLMKHQRFGGRAVDAGGNERVGRRTRNSSIELLRIIAMFMILCHHFVIHNAYNPKNLPMGWRRIFYQLFLEGGGKVGVVIFFTISSWFFLDKEQQIKGNLRRIWLMEREMLFYSVGLALLFFAWRPIDFGRKTLLKSIVPLNSGLWWYASAYAAFLVFLPYLMKGLKALTREQHLALAVSSLVLWGIPGFVPGMPALSPSIFSVLFFVYLFVLVSAYKWYLKPLTVRQDWLLIAVGFCFFLLYTFASVMLYYRGKNKDIFITGDWKIPVLMVGFGMFLLFNRWKIHSRIINRTAKSAFAVYLITDYPLTRNLLWKHWFHLDTLNQQPFPILKVYGILIAIYAVCTAIDFVRQGLFALTVDRYPGHWFELLWNRVENWLSTRWPGYLAEPSVDGNASASFSPRRAPSPEKK